MIKTYVTWKDNQLSVDEISELNNLVDELTVQGKTDGLLEFSNRNSGGTFTSERSWVDVESAQSWIDFVLKFNPVSTNIDNVES